MSTIHTARDGAGYKSWIDGCHGWCYGYGPTWQASVINLLQAFEATLGLGLHIEGCLSSHKEQTLCPNCGELSEQAIFKDGAVTVCGCEPLDGLAAENASEPLPKLASFSGCAEAIENAIETIPDFISSDGTVRVEPPAPPEHALQVAAANARFVDMTADHEVTVRVPYTAFDRALPLRYPDNDEDTI